MNRSFHRGPRLTEIPDTGERERVLFLSVKDDRHTLWACQPINYRRRSRIVLKCYFIYVNVMVRVKPQGFQLQFDKGVWMDRCPRVVMSLPESDAESYSSSHDPSPTLQIDSAAVRLVVETTAQSSSTTLSVKTPL